MSLLFTVTVVWDGGAPDLRQPRGQGCSGEGWRVCVFAHVCCDVWCCVEVWWWMSLPAALLYPLLFIFPHQWPQTCACLVHVEENVNREKLTCPKAVGYVIGAAGLHDASQDI